MQKTKLELVYKYLTRRQVQASRGGTVEKISEMQTDLEKERKAMTRRWAKRDAQIQGVIESTVGMTDDLQCIGSKALAEIDGLELSH